MVRPRVTADQPAGVSIVVVNYRTAELTIRAATAALAAAGERPVQAIVVDNASGDGSAERIATALPEATVIARPDNGGFATGVNAGLAAATHDLIAVVNSDAFLAPGALDRLASYLEAHPGAGVVGPSVTDGDGAATIVAHRRFPNLITLFVEFCAPLHPLSATRWHPHQLPLARHDRAGRVAHVTGAVLMTRRSVVDRAGPFDEGYFLYLEETEWQRRVTRAGWEVHLEPAAEAQHLGQGSDHANAVVSDHYLRSAERYFGPRARPVMHAAATISVASARVASRLRPGDERFPKLAEAFGRVRAATARGAQPRS
jgi:N-acetylglucosaminyl-diphospho-decaprenol L-rhamnosyltransferase